jgi:hypothetical protein
MARGGSTTIPTYVHLTHTKMKNEDEDDDDDEQMKMHSYQFILNRKPDEYLNSIKGLSNVLELLSRQTSTLTTGLD